MTKPKKDLKKETEHEIVAADEKKDESNNVESGKLESEKVSTNSEKSEESELETLKTELEAAKAKVDENWDLYLRSNAELENARRRAQQDIEKARKYGVEKLVEDLLPIKDSIEMGLVAAHADNANIEKLREGSELILKMFSDTMDKYGIETLDPTGESFNPERHQAMSLQESKDDKPNTVINVMQKGYLLNGRLIRPAMVIVAKKPTEEKQSAKTDADEVVGTNVDEKA